MRIKLIFKKELRGSHSVTYLTHIKVMTDDGKYVKFVKHTDRNLNAVSELNIDADKIELE